MSSRVVVSKNQHGQIVAVTRQDLEGRVLKVIAESPPQPVMNAVDRHSLWLRVIAYRDSLLQDDIHNSFNSIVSWCDQWKRQP